MLKLITPVQYESVLDELNQVRPLQLVDEGKTVLDIPVLDVIPIGGNRPASGKFLRCNKQGSLLQTDDAGYKNVETITGNMNEAIPNLEIEFAQKVYNVLVEVITPFSLSVFVWTDASGTILFKVLNLTGITFCEFVGTKMYFYATGGLAWSVTFKARGFY